MNKQKVVQKIIDVTHRSAGAEELCIYEITSLDDLIGFSEAEKLREFFISKQTQIRQITNQKVYDPWTDNAELAQDLSARYVPNSVVDIKVEKVIFGSTVAIYKLGENPFYNETNDIEIADQERSMFDHFWETGDAIVFGAKGAGGAKQYVPINHEFNGVPIVIYPAKDDGVITKAFSREKPGEIEDYISSVLENNKYFMENADMILAYAWNDETEPMCDLWRVERNKLSDDSGFLYDVKVFKGIKEVHDMGRASGNSSIVVTAEEMLLRKLILEEKRDFVEASNRKLFRAQFPIGLFPSEKFYLA
jgi:hypothetical protein